MRPGAATQYRGQPRRRALAIVVRRGACSCARSTGRSPAASCSTSIVFAICLPLVQRFRAARMPLVTRRWYDIPLRAALVATLVAVVVTLSNTVGPRDQRRHRAVSGRVHQPHPDPDTRASAAPRPPPLLANGQWGLIGFGLGDR